MPKGKRGGAKAVATGLAVLGGVATFIWIMSLLQRQSPHTVAEAVSHFGPPLCEADSYVLEPFTGGSTKVPLQVRLMGVRPLPVQPESSEARPASDSRVLLFSPTPQARFLVSDFFAEDVPAGRLLRFAAFFPRAELELVTVSGSGDVLRHESYEKPFLQLVAPGAVWP